MDPAEVLRRAHRAWAAAPAWTLAAEDPAHPDATLAAVRPGLQWMSLWQHTEQVLVRDGRAHVRGRMMQSFMVGIGWDTRLVHELAGEAWIVCDARLWLRGGHDHSAFGMMSKTISTDDAVTVQRETARELVLRLPDGTCTVRIDGEPSLVRLRRYDEPPQVLSYDDGDVPGLPDASTMPTLGVDEVLALLRARRRKRTPRKAAARVTVVPPDEQDDGWQVRSENVAAVLGTASALEAEDVVRSVIHLHDPELTARLEFDSYDSVLSIWTAEVTDAERVAELIRGMPRA